VSGKKQKRVFLTGAGGSMGGAALKALTGPERQHKVDIVVLDLPTPRNRTRLAPYADVPGVEIVWGDLTHYDDVLRCVTGANIVLHPAAFIAPAADHDPERAWAINVGSAQNIVRAIRSQPDPDAVRFVSIGTVAETGDRLPPIHVGRVGDPLKPSIFDMYACSKIAAERIVAESGLRHWVSLRQTFIPTTEMILDPIMYHQPLATCIEFCTAPNAGLVLANACEDDIPDDFWRRFYNIGGGSRSRVTYLEFMERLLALTGIQDVREVFDRRWFALRNFHCQWFEDSHVLNEFLHHQVEGLEDYLARYESAIPFWQKLASRLTPPGLVRRRLFEPLAARTPDSTMYWLANGMDARISAFFKSRADFESIPDWRAGDPPYPDGYDYVRLDHGYDEREPTGELDLEDVQTAAEFRGGECLSPAMAPGDLYTPLRWRCAFGHEFDATPNLILKGGHWCPDCAPPPWNFDEQARRSPFFAQVWYPNHDRDENHFYPEDCWKDILSSCRDTH
jgi:nucleoside-diphosphate-sugar epimerase